MACSLMCQAASAEVCIFLVYIFTAFWNYIHVVSA